MDTKDTLLVPYLPGLDACDKPETIIATLEADGARRIIGCNNWPEAFPYHPLSSFTIAHSGTAIYIDFFSRTNFLRAEVYQDQGPVSSDSCVEFFVRPEPDGEYWNFEFNCIGVLNASHRRVRPEPVRLTPEELARVQRVASCGTRPFCELEGIFSWNLLAVIPLDLIGVHYDGRPVEMEGNFYKCASAASQPHYLSWQPIHTEKPDFHRPEFFGKIILQ
ncbi:MAG: hypothetical protein K2M12_04010 [Muribaculaceae bacterium]|nr:hypothetical protein [Muribaculaceae bacterium]